MSLVAHTHEAISILSLTLEIFLKSEKEQVSKGAPFYSE
jgi:hypothetical protein